VTLVRGESARRGAVALVHYALGYLVAMPLYWFATAGRYAKTVLLGRWRARSGGGPTANP
jgi:hypothetical protein